MNTSRRQLSQTSSGRFLLFGYSGGVGNQLTSLANAVRLSALLRRTLIVPPVLSHSTSAGGLGIGVSLRFHTGLQKHSDACKVPNHYYDTAVLETFDALSHSKALEWDSVFDFTSLRGKINVLKYSVWRRLKMPHKKIADCVDEREVLERWQWSTEKVLFVGNTLEGYKKAFGYPNPTIVERAFKVMHFSTAIRRSVSEVLQALKWPMLTGSLQKPGMYTAVQVRAGDKPEISVLQALLQMASAKMQWQNVRTDRIWLGGDFFSKHAEWTEQARKSKMCHHNCAFASLPRLQAILSDLRGHLQEHAYLFLDLAFFSAASSFVYADYRGLQQKQNRTRAFKGTFAEVVYWKRDQLKWSTSSTRKPRQLR